MLQRAMACEGGVASLLHFALAVGMAGVLALWRLKVALGASAALPEVIQE
ncbi:hypothetical protein [Pseudomonas tructae]|nr:hypothetical protein [Pseudomonas tructae]